MSIEQDVLDKMQSRQATDEWVAEVVDAAENAPTHGRKPIALDGKEATKSAWTRRGKEVSAMLNRYRAKYPDTHGFGGSFQIRASRVYDSRTAAPIDTRVMFLLMERLFDELGKNPSEELRGQLVLDIQHLYKEVVERTMGNRVMNGTTLKGASRPRTKATKRKEPAAAAAASSMQAEASDDEEEDRQVKPKPDDEKFAMFNSLLLPLMQPAHFFVPQVRSANEHNSPVATYGVAKELDSPVATYGVDALLEAAASQDAGLGMDSQPLDVYDALTEDLEPLAHMPPARGASLLMERPTGSPLAFAHDSMMPLAKPPLRAGSNPLVASGAFPCDELGCSVMTDDPSGFCAQHRPQTGHKGSTRRRGPACVDCGNPLINELGERTHCARCVFLASIK